MEAGGTIPIAAPAVVAQEPKLGVNIEYKQQVDQQSLAKCLKALLAEIEVK